MLAPTPVKPSFKVDSPVQPSMLHSGPAHCYKKLIRSSRSLRSISVLVSSKRIIVTPIRNSNEQNNALSERIKQ